MRIVSIRFEMIRATSAIAEFVARVELDGSASECTVSGRAVGPRCPGTSTVEVAYPMTAAGADGTVVSLRGVIPEPNLWTPEAPFVYSVAVEVRGGAETDSRTATIALRGR